MGHRRGALLRGRAPQHGGGHPQRAGSRLGQGHPDRRRRFAQQLRRAAGGHPRPGARRAGAALARGRRRNGRRRVVRFGHRFRHSHGTDREGLAPIEEGRGPLSRAGGPEPQGPESLYRRADHRRLPRELPGRGGRPEARRSDRRDRRPQSRPCGRREGGNRPPLRRREDAGDRAARQAADRAPDRAGGQTRTVPTRLPRHPPHADQPSKMASASATCIPTVPRLRRESRPAIPSSRCKESRSPAEANCC